MESQLGSAGIDIGEALETPAETMPEHKEADTDLEAKRVETDSGTSDDKVKKANLNTDQEASVEEREKVITEIEASTINAVPEQESNQNESDE
jgi:hypothetical protein